MPCDAIIEELELLKLKCQSLYSFISQQKMLNIKQVSTVK